MISQEKAIKIFHELNAAGHGDSACECDRPDCGCDIDGLTHLGEQILHPYNDSEVAVYLSDTCNLLYIVGYVHGPWMVTIRASSLN